MKRIFLGLASAVLLIGGCSSGGDDSTPTRSAANTTQAVAVTTWSVHPWSETELCEKYCDRVRSLKGVNCEPGGSGDECATLLTNKVLLVMGMQNDDDNSQPDLTTAMAKVPSTGEKFAEEGCKDQDPMDMVCAMTALNLNTQFDIVATYMGVV